MRTFKFRVWNKVSKVLTQPHAVSDEIFSNPNLEIMQFTGLLDRNGKEIYEGDILKYYGEVVWIAQSASFRVNPTRDNADISFTESFLNIDDSEIAGNIFENPELLNK